MHAMMHVWNMDTYLFFNKKNPFKFQNKSNYDMNDAEHFVTHRYNNLDKFESWNMDAYLNKRLY